jgi:uncharacterized repeat protein (TIGR02543 family)
LAFLALSTTTAAAALCINEFQAWNWNTRADENGDYEDWIELYNSSASPINLAGYTLTDDPAAPKKWTFPPVSIGANGFMLVWASNKNRVVTGYPLHTNFRLENQGEFIGLYNPFGVPVDSATFGPQNQDASYGRKPDGSGAWVFFATPTPNAPNSTAGAPGFAAPPVFSRPGGPTSAPISVRLSTATPGAQIRYTVGGADPTAASTVYVDAMVLTTPTVIRAQTFAAPLFPSKVVTQTYLVNVPTSMPLMSVVTDPANLWGPNGIYYANLNGSDPRAERPCSVEYWEKRGAPGFAVTCGLRMRGGASQSRTDIAKKSFLLKFRRSLGPAMLEYPLFVGTAVDRFDKLALRANYNDCWTHWWSVERAAAIYVRDELTRVLRNEMADLASHGTQCLLLLNGHMWGIYNPCEHVDPDFLGSYWDALNWDILSLTDTPGACQVEDGDRIEWDAFYSWFSTYDLSVAGNYQQLQTMLDLQNYTDYMIGNIWQYNSDWPHHNGYVARARVAGAKWILLDWDIEYGLGGGPNAGTVASDLVPRATSPNWRISLLLSRLLSNASYRRYFAQRLDVLLNSALDEPHVIQRMNEQAALIRPGIPYETVWAQKWGETKTPSDWETALQSARGFVNARTPYLRQQVQSKFSQIPGGSEITGWMDVKVLPPVDGQGDVLLHTIVPPSYPWSGTFFRGIPLVLRAVPRPGYVFTGWSDSGLPTTPTVSLVLTASLGSIYTVYARFAQDMSPPAISSVEFVARNRMAVRFGKPVERASAQALANYTVNMGVGHLTSATLQTSPTIVLLTFANPLAAGVNYQLSVVGVRPLVGSPIPQSSPALANAGFNVPMVAITEIMYNSIGPDVEWVELHNTTNAPVDISGWCLTDDDVYPVQTEGSWIMPTGTQIPAGGYIVVGVSDDLSGWNFPATVPVVMPIVGHGGNLKNSGDTLALFTAALGGALIEGSLAAAYPDLAVAGRSIEKVDDDFQWSGNSLAWRQCAVPIPWATALGTHATPGRRNGASPSSSAARHWALY